MLATTSGMGKPACETKWRGAVTHSAIKGQSLLQSGRDALPGQQGMRSIASAVAESLAPAPSMAIGVSVAIAGRAIGASRSPATAIHAKNRLMVARILTPPSYHGCRVLHSGGLFSGLHATSLLPGGSTGPRRRVRGWARKPPCDCGVRPAQWPAPICRCVAGSRRSSGCPYPSSSARHRRDFAAVSG
jgi:hypothetical protein